VLSEKEQPRRVQHGPHRNLSFVCAAMSRTEYWREPPLTSRACAGSHVGLCAVDIFVKRARLRTMCLKEGKRTVC
jgi:hypothetical protein